MLGQEGADALGAPESNAGDDFHFWWAASRALALVEPGTNLRRITLEGPACVDDPDEAYETVDVAEYLGGDDVASATSLVFSQLKYSSRHPQKAWTAARLCEKRARLRADGSKTQPRSVARDLASAYWRLLHDHGPDAVAKVTIALVSNQPADPLLLSSVAAVAAWIRSQDERPQRATLLRALPPEQAAVVRVLADTVGTKLGSAEFCEFLTVLDLSKTGTLDRAALGRAVRAGAAELVPGRGPDSARRLFELVRNEAMPEAPRHGITAHDVLAELGAPEVLDLYPAPPRPPEVRDPLPAPAARALAETAVAQLGKLVVAHGPAGAGKTTALQQVSAYLPAGSVMVAFDCYGGGDYLSAGEERHTPQRFATQVVNELAQRCGTPLLVQPPHFDADLWRLFGRTLERAAQALDPGGVLVLAVDAADNAAVAALERGDVGFLPGLVRLPLPERVAVVLTARSHRVASLGADAAATVEIAPFDLATSAAHLRRHRPGASDDEAAAFHDRTGGNPRAQFYALEQADANGYDLPTLLAGCARTPEPVFKDLLESALLVSGADAGGRRWLALMLALARPVSMETLAEALGVGQGAVAAFAAGLAPGVKVADGAIQFRDEDFERYVRDRVERADVLAAHDRLADMFLGLRSTDADAAAHVADHLYEAGRLDDLLRLVVDEDAPAGIADGFRREHVQGRRLDLAVRAAAEAGDAAAAVRVAARGCDTASRFETLSRLVETRLDLVARYTDIDLLKSHALRQNRNDWLGPVLMRLAAALSRDSERHAEARDALEGGDAWLRRWTAGRDGEARHWRVEADDVAGAAEARYRLDGTAAAVAELWRWRPAEFALEAAAALARRLSGELSPDTVRDELLKHSVPVAAQAPVLAELAPGGSLTDRTWVNDVVTDLVAGPPEEPQAWQLRMLDAAVRHAYPQNALALARHWSRGLPAHVWAFAGADPDGITILRCHAAAAALAGDELRVETLIPTSLLPPPPSENGYVNDSRAQERRDWTEVVEPVAAAAVLATRAATGQAVADELVVHVNTELTRRTQRAAHRWFSYDRSYRAWVRLVAEAVVDSGAPPAVLDRLADEAPRLLRDGAPEVWLDLAEMYARRRVHEDRATELCVRASARARTDPYSAPDRLDIVARAADVAGCISSDVGRRLFDHAVEIATGINDDAARLLAVPADLARRASVPATDRATVAAWLLQAAENVAAHVTEPGVVPYDAIGGAATYLDVHTGIAAISRWDDEDRIVLANTLPAALTNAVDSGAIPARQALLLDHLIERDPSRLDYQLEIVARMPVDAGGTAAARIALARAADWLRSRVPARDQPALARRLLDSATAHSLSQHIQPALEPVLALGAADDPAETRTSRQWSGGDTPQEAQELLDNPGSRTWRTLAEDVAALDAAHVYGEKLRDFVTGVLAATPPPERIDALAVAIALPRRHSDVVIPVLAGILVAWRDWPGIAAWSAEALPGLLVEHLPDLAWRRDTDKLLDQLRAFADDASIRGAVLRALPEARSRLTSYGWQNVAALLGRLCGPKDAADALLGLLRDRLPDPPDPAPQSAEGPIPMLLWSTFGHPRREMRWRAAHAARDLLRSADAPASAALAASLVRLLDRHDAAPFRNPKLHFYRLSAMAATLIALHRVAEERPTVLALHVDELTRHAASRDLPHAQIRELARRTALAVIASTDPHLDTLRWVNQPTRCHVDRNHAHPHDDRRVSENRRYDFDSIDTIPYWYAPLARVFDVPVDRVAEFAETWIVDRWGLAEADWYTDARELRDERAAGLMYHRHGSIPPIESLRLYLEYHAMMTAGGELVDADEAIRIDAWESPADPWDDWLSAYLPAPGGWLADLSAAVPAEPDLFGQPKPLDDAWDTPTPEDFDLAFGLVEGQLPSAVLVAAVTEIGGADGRESIYVRSALVAPQHAEDLQRALAAASNPTAWKLPDEDEETFEVAHGAFELRGWLVDSRAEREAPDEHDPYARGLRWALPLPGRRFRETAHVAPDPKGLSLIAGDGSVVVRAEQWADRDPDSEYDRTVTSSGYRVRIEREALLRHLADAGMNLIVEVQIGRHRSGTGSDYRPPRSRIYLVDAAGRATRR